MAHILVVDDDAAIRSLIKDILSGQGHTFELASKGSEALEMIRSTRFDLVILDRNMPGMDGLEFLQHLRASPGGASLKVLMCTAAEKMSDVEEAFRSGASDYIVKPLDFAKLALKVANLTRKK